MQKNSKRSKVFEMYKNGLSLEEIRDSLEFETVSDVNRVLNQIGIKTGRAKKVSEEEKKDILKLYNDGMNGKEIAKLKEISNTAVYSILKGSVKKKYIIINKSEKSELPIPEIKKKVIVLPRENINGKGYIDVFKMIGGY